MTKGLPWVLVTDILSRLPVKSLMRLRCVSQEWLELLTKIDPYFVKLHLHQICKANKNYSIIAFPSTSPMLYYFPDVSTSKKPTEFEVPGSNTLLYANYNFGSVCSGLVCCYSNLSTDNRRSDYNLQVWNPLTGERIPIPCPPAPTSFSGYTPYTKFELGFLEDTNEYKVIRIFYWSNPMFGLHGSVYTLGTHSWRALQLGFKYYYVRDINSSAALVNGALHWASSNIDHHLLIAFDLKDEVFREMQPPNDRCHWFTLTVGALAGTLCVFYTYARGDIQAWVMKEYGVIDSWTKQFRIGHSLFEGLSQVRICPMDSGEILMYYTIKARACLYNPITNSCKYIETYGLKFDRVYAYKGSLFSLYQALTQATN